MRSWTISIGPVKEVSDSNLKTALNVIAEEVRSYRVPSKVMIARYAQELRRFHQGEIDALEEMAASTSEEVETTSIALRELAAPLMEKPDEGPTFHEYLSEAHTPAAKPKPSSKSSTTSQRSSSHA